MPATPLVPRSEKGLLTPHNCAVLIIDIQPQMVFGVDSHDRQAILNSNVILAKAARIFGVPLIFSTVESAGFSGYMVPALAAIDAAQVPIERTGVNAWDDANVVAAIEQTGRRKIILAGLWTETCVALPAIQMLHDGYDVYVAEDCCGDVSRLAHDGAMRRVEQAGAKPVTALSVLFEWQRDWAWTETYAAVMDVVKTHAGAFGIGAEYAATLVHGTEPTRLPAYAPAA